MDKLVVPIPSNGFPLNNDDIRFFLGLSPYSRGIYQALAALLKAYSDNCIVSGCEIAAGTMAEGWVMLDGELLKVDSHAVTDVYFEKVVTYNSNGNKQTQTGSTADSYQQNRATSTASSGNLINTNRLVGSETTLVNNDYTKTKINENIIISTSFATNTISLTSSGFYDGEECFIIINSTGGRVIVTDGTVELYNITGVKRSVVFIYIHGSWRIKSILDQ